MNNLKLYREQAGFTQEEFARACGFEKSLQPRMSLYESGDRRVDLAVIRIMIDVLHSKGVFCEIDDLFPPE